MFHTRQNSSNCICFLSYRINVLYVWRIWLSNKIIWGTWSILREGDEITECVVRMTHKRPAFISFIESVVVIILSIEMIVDPVEHHAHIHIILLGIELILEVIFPIFYGFLDKQIEKKLSTKDAASTEE